MAKTYNTISTFTSGQVLTAAQMNEIGTNSNNYRVPPLCRLALTGTSSVTSGGAGLIVPFGAADVDTDTMATTGAGAKITIKTAGVYQVSFAVLWTAGTSGNVRQATVRKNSTGTAQGMSGIFSDGNHAAMSNGLIISLKNSTLTSLAVNDTLDLNVFQDSGGPITVGAGNVAATFLTAAWVGQAS